MAYEVEVTDEWLKWFDDLSAEEQEGDCCVDRAS
jgi:hypothetical protein